MALVPLFEKLSSCAVEKRSELLQSAEDNDLYHTVGRNCEMLDGVCNNLSDIVNELRSRGITLNEPLRFQDAMTYIRKGYRQPPDEATIRRYARNLNQFLLMPNNLLPENPILTGSLPQWFQKGDEVACYSGGQWWHAVIVGEVSTRARLVNVFWVGWAECDTGSERSAVGSGPSTLYKNPTKCERGAIRSYRECVGVKEGSLADYSVDYILRKYCVIHVDQNSTACLESTKEPTKSTLVTKDSTDLSDEVATPLVQPSKKRATYSKLDLVAPKSTQEGTRPATRSTTRTSNADDADDENESSESEAGGKKRPGSKAQVEVQLPKKPRSTLQPLPKPRPFSKPQPLGLVSIATSRVEDFFWATLPAVTYSCIATLELLAAGKAVHPDVEKEGLAQLAGMITYSPYPPSLPHLPGNIGRKVPSTAQTLREWGIPGLPGNCSRIARQL